ncbi:MAG: hypothetical protein H6Q55_645 [Deltaproteobacteria bacterium]|nr:hypothetical protein [Deltaproteobacteria bacterium]
MTNLIPDHSILFWISAVCAVTLVGISKAGFGAGVGVVTTPLMALTISVADAAALLLPLLILCDIVAVYSYGWNFHRRSIKLLMPGALIGIAVGSLFFGFFIGMDHVMRVGIGVLAIIFVIFQATRAYILGALKERRPHAAEGVLMGTIAGFTSTLAHAGGPPIAIYLLPQKLSPSLYVGTAVIFFAIVNAVKLLPYWSLGMLKVGNIATIAMLAPLTYVGVKLGLYLNNRFSQKWFDRVVYGVLFLSGLQLLGVDKLVALLFK